VRLEPNASSAIRDSYCNMPLFVRWTAEIVIIYPLCHDLFISFRFMNSQAFSYCSVL